MIANKLKQELLKSHACDLDTNAVLTGIYFNCKNAVSTNGTRLFICDKPLELSGIYKTDLSGIIEGTYPTYENLIPKKQDALNTCFMAFNKEDLKDFVIALKGIPVNKRTQIVKLFFGNHFLSISTGSENMTFTSNLTAPAHLQKENDDGLQLALNVNYFIDIFNLVLKDKPLCTVNFNLYYFGEISPLLIEIVYGDIEIGTSLIMPVQLK